MYGAPAALDPGTAVSIDIRMEPAEGGVHEIHFNRGAVASQEYARRFQNRKPDQVADGSAYRWLSRGLEEAFVAFIARAKNEDYALRAAVYEFQWSSVLAAFKEAVKNKANVRIIYDAVPGASGPKTKNNAAIKKAALTKYCIPRTKGKLMHNKFIVLLKNGKPIAVWTGSTNATANGIFGHLNVGHVINDAAVATRYFEYWQVLSKDPATSDLKDWAEENDALPEKDAAASTGILRDLLTTPWHRRPAMVRRTGSPGLRADLHHAGIRHEQGISGGLRPDRQDLTAGAPRKTR